MKWKLDEGNPYQQKPSVLWICFDSFQEMSETFTHLESALQTIQKDSPCMTIIRKMQSRIHGLETYLLEKEFAYFSVVSLIFMSDTGIILQNINEILQD